MKRKTTVSLILAGALLALPATASASFHRGTYIHEALAKVQQALSTVERPTRSQAPAQKTTRAPRRSTHQRGEVR